MESVTYLQTVAELCTALNTAEINRVIDLFEDAYREGQTIFIFGNGGSGANASHFAQDLTKGTVPSLTMTKRLRTVSLTDNVSHILALANDEGYETIFEQQMIGLAQPTDIAVGISGSGNSENVLRAIRYANEHGMTTVGFTGYDGGRLRPMVAYNIHVPNYDMGLVESLHMVAMHLIITELKERIGTE
jgi:D-sedoheptulose 7-phosphate isomerase